MCFAVSSARHGIDDMESQVCPFMDATRPREVQQQALLKVIRFNASSMNSSSARTCSTELPSVDIAHTTSIAGSRKAAQPPDQRMCFVVTVAKPAIGDEVS